MHTYGGHGGGGSSYCPQPSVDYLMEQQARLVKIRDEFPQLRQVPLVFQEWGVTSGGTTGVDKQPLAVVRNTNYAAAFLSTLVARQIEWRRNENPRVGDLFVCLSGYEKERQRDFEGKRTVETIHGFEKPVLNAYRLLAHLGGQLVASSLEPADKQLSAVAARDGQRQMAVVVTHFSNDRIDSDGPTRAVKLAIVSPWPDGTRIELRHWRIDAEHSNAYTVFCRLGKPNLPTPEQTQQIKQQMALEPLQPPQPIVIQGKVNVAFDLPCNAVSLVELITERCAVK